LGVIYRKIADSLAPCTNLPVAPAPFVRAEQRLADLALPTYDLLLEALRQSPVVHVDETGWRIGRLNAWLWVFSSKVATIYVIRSGVGARGHQVPGDNPRPDFDGYLAVGRPKKLRRARGRQGPLQRPPAAPLQGPPRRCLRPGAALFGVPEHAPPGSHRPGPAP